MEVSLLVPENAQINDWYRNLGIGVNIVKAKKKPGFSNPSDWLYYPPEDLKTDFVIGIGMQLGRIAQHWKEQYQCNSIYIDHNNTWINDYKLVETFEDLKYYGEELSIAANIPVAIGPKTTDDLSASLCSEAKEVFNFTCGIFCDFTKLTHATRDRLNFRILVVEMNNLQNFQEEGLNLAAEIMTALNGKSYHLIYISAGKGVERQFANKFREGSFGKRQLTVRSLPQTEKEWEKLFCGVDLAIMPSGDKEFGLESLLALSAGLPVLVHGESGFGEALRDVTFGTSAIVDSDDAREWASRIKTIRETDRKTRLEQAAKLRSNYDEKYSWEEQCAALLEKMYRMVSGMGLIPYYFL